MVRADTHGGVAVLTAALPDRFHLLAESIESVRAQTRPPDLHVIGVDYEHAGCVATMNRLMATIVEARCDWVALLADDDALYPDHLATLLEHADGADIVYSWCKVEGRDWNPNSLFDSVRLRRENYIPSTTLLRCSLVRKLKGWNPDAAFGFEDWDFWLRALDVGARFVCVPEVTWRYRFHGSNMSAGGVAHAAAR